MPSEPDKTSDSEPFGETVWPKGSKYKKAASYALQHYRQVLDELTEELIEADGNDDPVIGPTVGGILESYAHKLWSIEVCNKELVRVAKMVTQHGEE
jgi:hypothetical protein